MSARGRTPPPASTRDLYAVLAIAPDASPDALRSAYRRLARSLHPDVSRSPGAEARFAEIAHAYSVLSDPEQRRMYDATRWPAPLKPEPEGDDASELFDVFNACRGKGFGGGQDRGSTR